MPLPCFFPSVSSVKTNLMPVDYVELLYRASVPHYLVSAFDIDRASEEHRQRMGAAIEDSKKAGSVVLMDSGNYEGFWTADSTWTPERFHIVCSAHNCQLCFCFDNQKPPSTADAIAEDVVARVMCDQDLCPGTIIPIVHGPSELLPKVVRQVVRQLCPLLVAVPERVLGDGIVNRIRTVREIRRALDTLDYYCPLHLLGTCNPLSLIAFGLAGADTFDGLEWCQTVVDHTTGLLYHFQQWDLFRGQTEWGTDGMLPYIQAALMHNLVFYNRFMHELRCALEANSGEEFLRNHLPRDHAETLLGALRVC